MSRLTGFLKKLIKKLARPRGLLAACYIAALAWWLGAGLFTLMWDRAQPELRLTAEDAAALVQAEAGPGGEVTTTGGDGQLIFEGLNAPLRRVLLEAEFAGEPGEMELFYTRKEGQGFSAGRGLLAVQGPGGAKKPLITLPGRRAIGAPVEAGYLYTLPPGTVRDLRLDLGMAAGNTVKITALVLNPRLPAWRYFVPDLRQLALLAAGPALACCGIMVIIELLEKTARRAGRREKPARKRG